MKPKNFPGRKDRRRREAIQRGLDPIAEANTKAKLVDNAELIKTKKNRGQV